MSTSNRSRFLRGWITLALAVCALPIGHTAESQTIDLPTALKLAGANNLDVEIARARLDEARAAHGSARARFFPWISPAITLRRHEGNIQNVEGRILDVDKQSVSAAITLNAQLDFGETYYQNLAARQVVKANEAALAGRQQEANFRAAAAYFELARTRAAVLASEDAARISSRHAEQIATTTELGITFIGDAARVRSARERAELLLVRTRGEQRIAAARLAEVLRIDPAVELVPVDADLAPLTLAVAVEDLGALISRALAARPELDEAAARLLAASTGHRAAKNAPLIPTLGAQATLGGLGGGPSGSSLSRDYDYSGDYALGISWRVGPGGLFDHNRRRETAAREKQAELAVEKLQDAIRLQVVETHTRLTSLAAQIELARKGLEAADQTARLSRQRRETGVSGVLEDLQAEDELARARRDYLAIIADYNLTQYALRYVTGQ